MYIYPYNAKVCSDRMGRCPRDYTEGAEITRQVVDNNILYEETYVECIHNLTGEIVEHSLRVRPIGVVG